MRILRSLWHALGVLPAERSAEPRPMHINPGSTRLVVVELQRQHDSQHSTWDKLDAKLISLMGWSTLTFAVLASLSLEDIVTGGHVLPMLALLVTLALFTAVLVTCVKALYPKSHGLPVSTDWEVMAKSYLTLSEQEASEQLLAQYREVIDQNSEIIEHKAKLLQRGYVLFPVLALVLLVTAMYPVWQGWLP